MIFSIIGLIVIFPLIMALAILINKEFSDPGFYRSLRVIRYGKPFRIFKFRTLPEWGSFSEGINLANYLS